MIQNYKLIFTISTIYLKDETENAHISAIHAIAEIFNAGAGILFYTDVENKYAYCLNGETTPRTLTADQWHSVVTQSKDTSAAAPLLNESLSYTISSLKKWVSVPIRFEQSHYGCFFLGNNDTEWNREQIQAAKVIADALGEIISIRIKKRADAKSLEAAEKELKRTQERISRFFASFHDMIYTLDSKHIVTNINKAGAAMLGFKDIEEVIGKPFSDFAVNADFHEFFMRKLHKDSFIDDCEILLRQDNGTPMYCVETACAIKTPEGEIIEIQGLIKDISDRIKSEQNLWKMNIELADLNIQLQNTQSLLIQQEKLAAIGQLAAGIAHEINNPLGFLVSNQNTLAAYFESIGSAYEICVQEKNENFDMLRKKNDLDYIFTEIPKIFEESSDGFARIVQIVSNLKTFSRKDQEVRTEPFNINAGIESTLAVAMNEIKYIATVTKNLQELPKIYVRCGEINQVILNILINSAQAIASQKRATKGRISIESRQENNTVVICISDDGPGISEPLISKVFDPFFTTKEPEKGTGLGLSISYDIIVNKHNGKLSVTSVPGKETTFRIELPIER